MPWWRRPAVMISASAVVVVLTAAFIVVAVARGAAEEVAAPVSTFTSSPQPSATPTPTAEPAPEAERPVPWLDLPCSELVSAELLAAAGVGELERIDASPITSIADAISVAARGTACGVGERRVDTTALLIALQHKDFARDDDELGGCMVHYEWCEVTAVVGEISVFITFEVRQDSGATVDRVWFDALVEDVLARVATLPSPGALQIADVPSSAFSWSEWWEEPTVSVVSSAFERPQLAVSPYDEFPAALWRAVGFSFASFWDPASKEAVWVDSIPDDGWVLQELAQKPGTTVVTIAGADDAFFMRAHGNLNLCFELDDMALCVGSDSLDAPQLQKAVTRLVAAIRA